MEAGVYIDSVVPQAIAPPTGGAVVEDGEDRQSGLRDRRQAGAARRRIVEDKEDRRAGLLDRRQSDAFRRRIVGDEEDRPAGLPDMPLMMLYLRRTTKDADRGLRLGWGGRACV